MDDTMTSDGCKASTTKDRGFSCSVARRNADDTHAAEICSERFQPLDPVHRHTSYSPHRPGVPEVTDWRGPEAEKEAESLTAHAMQSQPATDQSPPAPP